MMGVALVAGVCAQAANAATITVFSGAGSRAAWEAAANGFVEETFDDAILLPGLSVAAFGGGHTGFGVSGGNFNDRLIAGSSTVWTTPSASGFGGNWDLSPGGAGLGIAMTAGAEVVATEIPDSFSGEFFGIITDFVFTSVTLTSGSQGGVAETYDMDNLVLASPIPEPSSIVLFGLGTLGIALIGRRQRRRRMAS